MAGPHSYASVGYYGHFTYIACQRGYAAMSVCYEESRGHWYEADDDYYFIVTIRALQVFSASSGFSAARTKRR